ncbi:pyridoxal-phosphate dependent enzyme [Fragilaria crotonensis]|nr:pyridoxal-phosphate dependent enzyme [Fragilaria crotonensis]
MVKLTFSLIVLTIYLSKDGEHESRWNRKDRSPMYDSTRGSQCQLPTPMLGRNRNQSRFQCLNEGNDDTDTTSENEDILGSLSSLQQAIQFAMKRSQSGGLVIEGTSGSTGISLATLCAARGHACLVVLPDDQAPEKKRILEVLGATVRIVPTASISNPNHYVNVAKKLASVAREQGIAAVFIDQFENLANFKVHYEHTGPEIYNSCPQLDAFCMSSGTGGTIAGVAKYLKERKPSVRIVLVDPPGSALYHAVQHGIAYAPQQQERALKRHRYDTIAEGIGLDRLTTNFNHGIEFMDESVRVSDQEAVDMAYYLLQTEGLWVGLSSAMNVVGAVRAALALPPGSTVVTVICDAGQRHVARFWNKDFIADWGLIWPQDSEVASLPECMKEVHS